MSNKIHTTSAQKACFFIARERLSTNPFLLEMDAHPQKLLVRDLNTARMVDNEDTYFSVDLDLTVI